jgi:hypothetical protein
MFACRSNLVFEYFTRGHTAHLAQSRRSSRSTELTPIRFEPFNHIAGQIVEAELSGKLQRGDSNEFVTIAHSATNVSFQIDSASSQGF